MGFGLHAFSDLPGSPNDSALNPDDDKFRLDSLQTQTHPLRYLSLNSGMFFPICILLFFNYNVVVGMADTDSLLKMMVYITMFLYLMVALRGSSVLKGERMEKKSKEIFEVRPYL